MRALSRDCLCRQILRVHQATGVHLALGVSLLRAFNILAYCAKSFGEKQNIGIKPTNNSARVFTRRVCVYPCVSLKFRLSTHVLRGHTLIQRVQVSCTLIYFSLCVVRKLYNLPALVVQLPRTIVCFVSQPKNFSFSFAVFYNEI